MKCPICGAENILGGTFCIKCGAKLPDGQQNNVSSAPLNSEPTDPVSQSSFTEQPVSTSVPTPTISEPPLNPQPNQETYSPTQPVNPNNTPTPPLESQPNNGENKNSKKLIILIGLIILLIIIGVVVTLFLKKGNNTPTDISITDAPAFFIKDENNKYALFNDDGKQLTDFIFTSTSDFINGTALVKKDNEYGIINTNGKMTVDFGKYSYITDVAGMYKVSNKDSNYTLINGKGNLLYDLKDKELTTYVDGYYSILEDRTDKTYKVLNSQGKVMTSFSIVGTDEPKINQVDSYISVFYNNKNVILNESTGKELVSFNDNRHYCVNKIDSTGNIILLNSCVGWDQSQDQTYHKIIKNNKLYDVKISCEQLYFKNDDIICTKDYKDYLLDENYNLGMEITEKIYVNENTYAQSGNESSGVDFYNNNKLVTNVACRSLRTTGYSEKEIYILETYYDPTCGTDSKTYEYYNTNGQKLFNKSFTSAELFNSNGIAIVSENNIYYLMDTTGKKISSDYDRITFKNDYYIVSKNNLKGLVNQNGEQVVDCKYQNIEVIQKNNKNYASLKTTDSKYIFYDIEAQEEKITLDSTPEFFTHYLLARKNDNNIQYYLFNGKLLYESK